MLRCVRADVAERVAALDIMSNGRVEFGSGRSTTMIELGGFGINPHQFGGLDHDRIMESIRHFGEEIIPHFNG